MSENPKHIITNVVRLSYCNIAKPYQYENGDPKYSACIIIPKSDIEMLGKIKEAIKAANENGKEKFGKKWIPPLRNPLRDGDEEKPDDINYKDSFFINANSPSQPGILDTDKTRAKSAEIIYSGCYAYVAITFYPFYKNGNKGIGTALNNIFKFSDGERMSGTLPPEQEFLEFETITENPFSPN